MRNLYLIIIVSVTGILVGYSLGRIHQKSLGLGNLLESQTSPSEILLEFRPVAALGINEDEKEQIEKLVDTFERYKYQKNADKLLAMFTLPETPEDQNDLNTLLGKDYVQGSSKPLSRLFSTQGYNHSVGGHYVRSIKRDGNSTLIEVDELRIFYTGLSEDFVGYSAKVVKMMIELEKNNSWYQIVKYYHVQPDDKFGSKYEGFIAY